MNKIINDASASMKGTIYQFYVALERCFLLESGQKLWIEKFGDVTVSGEIQIETKHYKGYLNDLHRNFWNTLANWMDKSFNHIPYKELVLYTTQDINKKSKLYNWNKSSAEEKLCIIKEIINTFQKNDLEITKSNEERQKILLHGDDFLLNILKKVYISYNSPDIIKIEKKIIEVHAKFISESKKIDFIHGLIGFIINSCRYDNNWEITFDKFEEKVRSLANHFSKNIIKIPEIKSYIPKDVEYCEDKLFIKKITEIKYEDVKAEAFRDYSCLKNFIYIEFKNCEIEMEEFKIYYNNLKRIFISKHRGCALDLSNDVIKDSQRFFNKITESEPERLSNFGIVPIEIRNGIFHDLLDIEKNNLKWKLKDE
ncbi:hypothetical protein [Fluviispira vulneris]|uniref:hypothetical protein n=1 Tax=Fluviispira vulneris TaxID=2763012 RepID=UPI00164713AC|nr:hypothetical protein [Fluviispira vulneris]